MNLLYQWYNTTRCAKIGCLLCTSLERSYETKIFSVLRGSLSSSLEGIKGMRQTLVHVTYGWSLSRTDLTWRATSRRWRCSTCRPRSGRCPGGRRGRGRRRRRCPPRCPPATPRPPSSPALSSTSEASSSRIRPCRDVFGDAYCLPLSVWANINTGWPISSWTSIC